MLHTRYAPQDLSINHDLRRKDEKSLGGDNSVVIVGSETERRSEGTTDLAFGGYLERFDQLDGSEGVQQARECRHRPQTHHHQFTQSTSSQASSSSSLSSGSQSGQLQDQTRSNYPPYPYPRDLHRRHRDDPEDPVAEGGAGRMPEMDSPGKTSDLSSSMWSVCSVLLLHCVELALRIS